MKVGIITVHSVPNYGAVLQAYASAAKLRELGHEATIIDYRQPDLEKLYRFHWRFPPPLKHWLRLRRNTQFVESHQPLSPARYHSREQFLADVDNYDAFITGSDQVWFTGPVQYYDPLYFLDFPASGKLKISYAPSAGSTTDFGEFTDKVRAALSDFHAVSVRDTNTADLVEPLLGARPQEVVDPVFLHDFEDLAGDPPFGGEPYLVVFGNFNGQEESVRQVAKRQGLEHIISLQYPCAAATKRIASPSPQDWVNWIKHSSFVLTSYFHGTAFAVKFQRPFLAVPTPGRRIKTSTLLGWTGLSNRCFLENPEPSVAAERSAEIIDWSVPKQNLTERIQSSEAFLKAALS